MDKKSDFESKKSKKIKSGFILTYWKIFDISMFGRDKETVLKIVEDWIESEAKSKWIATVNPEFVMKALKNDDFKSLLRETDLNVTDGIGLIWARELDRRISVLEHKNLAKKILVGAKIGGEILQGKHRDNIVSGSDLIPDLCKLAGEKKYKVFFLGGFGDRAKRTMEYFSKYKIESRSCSGEPDFSNEEVLKEINSFKPDILFVAYGMKKQEEWIKNNRNKANFGVAIGVGRSFDYYSGDLKRAPKTIRKMGMEWLYSLIKEPNRWKRQLELPRFIWKVLNK